MTYPHAGQNSLQAVILRRLWLLYLVWVITTGSVVAFVTPPWQNPDEGTQVERTVQISHGGLLGRRVALGAGGLSDPAIDLAAKPLIPVSFHADRKVTADMAALSASIHWGRLADMSFPNTVRYPPLLYLPSIPAVWIGRGFGLTIDVSLYLVRLCNVLAAGCVGAAALALARRTRLAIAAMLVLPMSVALGAAAGQDAFLLPVAALAVALIDRSCARISSRAAPGGAAATAAGTTAAIGLCLLAVITARPPYLPLALLPLLLPPAERGRSVWLSAGVVALSLAWSGYVASRLSTPMNGADAQVQAVRLLHHPLLFISIMRATLATFWDQYLASLVGIMGWMDTTLPNWFVHAATAVLLLAMFSAAAPAQDGGGRLRLLTLAGCVAAVLGIFLATYLTWDAVGATRIEGIQGRYFLPLLPPVALGLPSLGRCAGWLSPPALLGVLLLAAATPAMMVTTLIGRYYLGP